MTPGRLDRPSLVRKLAALDASVSHLRTLASSVSRTQLNDDLTTRWAVLHGLQLAAQTCLDIAAQVAVAEGRDATDYASALDTLADIDVLPTEFARRFRGLAGFRNVVVHEYLDVDLDVVFTVLTQHLTDLEAFAQHLRDWLSTRDTAT